MLAKCCGSVVYTHLLLVHLMLKCDVACGTQACKGVCSPLIGSRAFAADLDVLHFLAPDI